MHSGGSAREFSRALHGSSLITSGSATSAICSRHTALGSKLPSNWPKCLEAKRVAKEPMKYLIILYIYIFTSLETANDDAGGKKTRLDAEACNAHVAFE